ncbi:MAG TPA: hypothetical protein VGG33_27115 [Polyangia bacterium]
MAKAPDKHSADKKPPPPPPKKPPTGRNPPGKPPSKAAPPGKPPAAPARPAKPHKPQPAFGKKNQPPTAAAFAARLPLALGKRFEAARAYLLKQPGVTEDVYFYGPETGWALRYRQDERPLCSLHIYDEQPIGIVSLDPAASAGIDWRALSPVAVRARKQAHGSPALLWLDIPLEGTGANDLRSILRAKLAATASSAASGANGGGRGKSARRASSEDEEIDAAPLIEGGADPDDDQDSDEAEDSQDRV